MQEVTDSALQGTDLVTILANAGIVTGIIDALRRAAQDKIDWARFGALIAIGMGIVTSEAAVYLDWYGTGISWQEGLLVGLNVGLSASGFNRMITQAPPTVVVEGTMQGSRGAGVEATATMPDPTVTDEPTPRTPGARLAPSNPIIPNQDDPPGANRSARI